MSVTRLGSTVVQIGAKAYGILPAEPTSTYFTSITAGVSKSWGSWTEVVASTAADYYLVGYSCWITRNVAAGEDVAISIGTGAAASEVEVFAQYVGPAPSDANTYLFRFPVPIYVPAATRIAVRATTDITSAPQINFSLLYLKASVVRL